MGCQGNAPRATLQLPAHPEVHDEHVAGIELEQQVLASALDLRDLAPVQARREVLALRVTPDDPHGVLGALDLGRLDPAAHDVTLQVTTHDLDLGELHPSPYAPLEDDLRNWAEFHLAEFDRWVLPTPIEILLPGA